MARRQIIAAGVALVFVSVAFVAVSGVGPEVPGPPIRDILGLAKAPEANPCTPTAAGDRTPSRKQPADVGWERLGQRLPAARDELRVVSLDGTAVVLGGNEADDDGRIRSSRLAQQFVPASKRISELAELPTGLDHAVVGVHRGRVYIASGSSDFDRVSEVWSLAPGEGEWRPEQSIPTPRFAPAGGVVGDHLYVVGGNRSGEEDDAEGALEILDIERGTWASGAPMPTARHHAAAAVLDGKLFVVGGRDPDDFSLDTVESYDPETDSWQQETPLPQGLGGPAAVVHDGRLIVIAGGDDIGSDGTPPWVSGGTWALDPSSGSWARLADVGVPRHGHDAALIGDTVYIFGGSPCAGYGRTGVIESLQLG